MNMATGSTFENSCQPAACSQESALLTRWRQVEQRRAQAYPISRWYVRPFAGLVARCFQHTSLRSDHVTWLGVLAACAAIGLMLQGWMWGAGAAAMLAWFFDRLDGQLARLQHRASAWGAWLDGNLDELVDVAWHIAAAAVLAARTPLDTTPPDITPWLLVIAFLGGKYLFAYGLSQERELTSQEPSVAGDSADSTSKPNRLAWLYHLPANADVRLHLFVVALLTNLLWWELLGVACYYNARWLLRYGLVARRLRSGGLV